MTEFMASYHYLHNIIQLLTGDEGNIWYAGPEDKMLPEAEGRNLAKVKFFSTQTEKTEDRRQNLDMCL